VTGSPDNAPTPGNWGRWGAADQRGALNHLTEQTAVDAARLVRRGRVYPLGLEISPRHRLGHPARPGAQHFMTLDGGDFAAGVRLPGGAEYAEDQVLIPTHATTHIDALGHYWRDGLLYNGHPASRVRSYGATRCGIEHVGAIVTRAIVVDLAAANDVEHLPPGHLVTAAELAAAASRHGLDVRAGDCVLLHTGWQRLFARDEAAYHRSHPGIGLAAARWLAERDICAVAADTIAVEFKDEDGRYDGGAEAPVVHPFLIRDHGIYLLEMLHLEDLAADGVGECMFVAGPLRIVGGTASPVNPIALT
jgi:kynurenine formamidase